MTNIYITMLPPLKLRYRLFLSHRKIPLCPFVINSLSQTLALDPGNQSDCCAYSFLFFLEFHMRGIAACASFSIWILCFSIMVLSVIHIGPFIHSLFLSRMRAILLCHNFSILFACWFTFELFPVLNYYE